LKIDIQKEIIQAFTSEQIIPEMELKKKKCCKKYKKGKRCKKCPAYNLCGADREIFC